MAGRKASVAFGVAVGLIACVLLVACYQADERDSGKGELLSEFLLESGYVDNVSEWIGSLSDEQKAIVDIAYESDVTAGYQGSEEDWASDKLFAHHDSGGDIVVVLPDGGEFTVPVNDGDDAASAPSVSGEGLAGDSPASGAIGALFAVDTVHARPGDAGVAVAVRIERNPGILGATLSVSYDESVLTLKNAENGEAFKDALSLTRSRTYATGCLFTWDGVELEPDDVRDGVILTLYFDIAPDAVAGAYPVAVRSDGSVLDADLEEVGVSVQDGSVVVE